MVLEGSRILLRILRFDLRSIVSGVCSAMIFVSTEVFPTSEYNIVPFTFEFPVCVPHSSGNIAVSLPVNLDPMTYTFRSFYWTSLDHGKG